jgi:hypothetical protein
VQHTYLLGVKLAFTDWCHNYQLFEGPNSTTTYNLNLFIKMEASSGEQIDWRARAHHFDSPLQTGRSLQFTAAPNMAPFATGSPATSQGPTHTRISFIPCGVAGNGENFGSSKWACSSLPPGAGAAGNGEHPTISRTKGYKSSPEQLNMDDLHMMSTPDLEALLSSFARKPAPWDEATVRLTR